MFGNLIKLVLFAVIIASVALFARDRMNPPETAPETVSSASDDAAGEVEAAPDATPPESVDTPQPPVSQTASAPTGTGSTAVAETETGTPQAAPASGSVTPPEPAVSSEASPPPAAAGIGPAAGVDQPMSSVPDTAPLSEQAAEVIDTQATDAAATLPVPAETEPAAPAEMAPLPPVHPGPDDTSLPSDPAPPQPPLTQ